MRARLTFVLLVALKISLTVGTHPRADEDDDDDTDPGFRGFGEYETWKPNIQPAAPEVILIKQKEPHHHHDGHGIGSILKHNLPLWAVLAPLVAVSVLLPLKAYLGPSYIVYPPVPPTGAPPSMRDRVGKVEDDDTFEEHQSMSSQLLNLIEEFEKFYEELSSEDEA